MTRTPSTVSFGLAFIRQTLFWVAKHRREFDLIHGHSGFLDYLLTSRLSQAISGKPGLHSLYCPVPTSHGRWNVPPYKRLLKIGANSLAALTAFSRNVQKSLNLYGINGRHIPVTCPPIDLERFYPGPGSSSLRSNLGLGVDDFVLLFVGNTKPAKNLTTILQALYQVRQSWPHVKLIVTTELKHASPDERIARLAEQIRELSLEPAIIQLGIVDNMPDLMRLSDAVIAPFVNTLGPSDYFMAALEGMACGKPVIVSPVGGMPEIVDAKVGFLVNPLAPTEIAAAIQNLALDRNKRLELGLNAASLAQKMFAPHQVAQQFDVIYRSIV
jgi:glycosyltransferase involved in cell wall biosynthesis